MIAASTDETATRAAPTIKIPVRNDPGSIVFAHQGRKCL